MMIFRAGDHRFRFPCPTLIMGVLNVTPDSFSDGGQFLAPEAAVQQARAMVDQGADIIDVGGESTRPDAEPVDEREELRRVLPVIEALASQLQTPLSIDTVKPEVARASLEAGASIVNDVGANRTEPAMWRLIANTGAGYVAMHMQGNPQTMQKHPAYQDPIEEISAFFEDRLRVFKSAGMQEDQVALDVGIGFGKTLPHNLQLLAGIQRFTKWDRPLLIGVSRKSFLGKLANISEPQDRLPGSLAGACWAVSEGAHIIRAHDVAATRQALTITEAIIKHRSNDGLSGHPRPPR